MMQGRAKTRHKAWRLALPLLLACSAGARAELLDGWDFGIGLEHHRWQEYPINAAVVPKESGDLLALSLGWRPDEVATPYVAYAGKIYAGTVNYNTASMPGNLPVQTTSDYVGMVNEARGFIPFGVVSAVVGLGYDYWKRALADASAGPGVVVQGYTETWSSVFLRAGVAVELKKFALAGGLKHTVQNTIETGFFGTVHPGASNSPYAEGSYRFSERGAVAVYYDSYRFAQSPINAQGFYQPKSSMDRIGVRLVVAN